MNIRVFIIEGPDSCIFEDIWAAVPHKDDIVEFESKLYKVNQVRWLTAYRGQAVNIYVEQIIL